MAALIISVHGRHELRHGGLTMSPRAVERVMTRTARQTPCPSPPNFAYPDDRDPSFDGVCEGTLAHNGIYGRGIVNALTAVLHLPGARRLRGSDPPGGVRVPALAIWRLEPVGAW